MMVLIKSVCTSDINLRETIIVKDTLTSWIIWLVGIGMFIVPIIFVILYPPNLNEFLPTGLVTISIVGIIISFMNIINGYGKKSIPVYEVYTYDFYFDDIIIEKTTPEKDQEAICKAARKFEMMILEKESRRKELARIAEKCK